MRNRGSRTRGEGQLSIEAILGSRIVVCAGSGGVGKTTVSAAIALEAARRGRKTIVVTIDPAKRLANALGLKELSNEPRRIPKRKFTDAGLEQAPLYAMMLDTKRTFDALVIRYAKGPEQAERILGNHLYQAFSGAMSGTHEYMAMEKLYELDFEATYDLIVIDTPPTRNAMDFLEAPKHLTSFFEGRLLKWFLIPAIGGGKGLFRAVNFAAVSFLKAVTRVVGAEVLKDTAEFAANFEGMYDGFKERAQAVYELLRQPATAFVVVTTPHDQAVEEALFFATTLNRHRLPFGGLVVNRIHPEFDVALPDGTPTGSPVVDRLVQLAGEFEQGRKREDRSLRRLEWEVPQERWARIPYLSGEVTDLGSLVRVADCMFA